MRVNSYYDKKWIVFWCNIFAIYIRIYNVICGIYDVMMWLEGFVNFSLMLPTFDDIYQNMEREM